MIQHEVCGHTDSLLTKEVSSIDVMVMMIGDGAR